MRSFDELPLHIIQHILEYLSLYDRNCASLTCRQWFTASKCQKLNKKVELFLHRTILPVNIFMSSSRVYENIRLDRVYFENDLPFWQKFGINVKELTINKCTLENDKFIEILNHLPALEKLTLSRCFNLTEEPSFMEFHEDQIPMSLKNLKSLNFKDMEKFTGVILKRITRINHNIEEFNCWEDIEKYEKLKPFECFNFIHFYRRTLKKLSLCKDLCDNLFQNGPIRIDELDLEELFLYYKRVPYMIDFIISQKNLTKLSLLVNYLSDKEMKLICHHLSKLESFTLEYIDDVITLSDGIQNLKNFKALYLHVKIPIEYITQAVAINRNEKLQVLIITVATVDDEMEVLLENLPNLREFCISFDRMRVDLFQLIYKYLVNLEILEIFWEIPRRNKNLIYETELYNIGRLIKLKSLKLHFPAQLIHGFTIEHLMKLKNLRKLLFFQTKPSTRVAVQKKLMQELPLLEDVDFSFWKGIKPKVIRMNGRRIRNTVFEDYSSNDLSAFAQSGRPYTCATSIDDF